MLTIKINSKYEGKTDFTLNSVPGIMSGAGMFEDEEGFSSNSTPYFTLNGAPDMMSSGAGMREDEERFSSDDTPKSADTDQLSDFTLGNLPSASGMTLDDHTPTPEEKQATSIDVGDYDDLSAGPEEKTDEDDDLTSKVTKQFEKLASFKGFESWYGGELKKLFNEIKEEDFNEEFVEDLKNVIIPIKALTGTVMSRKFSEKLGKALMGLYNALTAFYNFITSEGEDRKLEELDSNGYRRPEFEQLNETATGFYEPSEDEWEEIKDFFEGSVANAVDSLIDAYDEIERRINQLETEKKEGGAEKEETKAGIDFTASTRRNQDIIRNLADQKIITVKDWKYKKENIITPQRGPKQLKNSIEHAQRLISEALQDLSNAQAIIFTGKLSESIEKVKEIANQKKYFRSLNETLKESASQLDKYIANLGLQKNTTGNLEELAPFIINMDEIVAPILNKILELNEKGSLDFKYPIKGNYRFNDINEISRGEALIIHDDVARGFDTKKRLQSLATKCVHYLHDPESVGLTEEKMAQEEKKAKEEEEAQKEKLGKLGRMDNDELYAHFLTIAMRDSEKDRIRQTKEDELGHLLHMQYVLEDKESVDIGKDLLDIHHSPAGKFDYRDSDAMWDSDSDRPLDTSSLPDKKDDDDREKATEKKKQSLYIELRTMLRVIGLIAKKYNLENYYYDSSHTKHTTYSLGDLLKAKSINEIYNKKSVIVNRAQQFVIDYRKITNPKSKDKAGAQETKMQTKQATLSQKTEEFLDQIEKYPVTRGEPEILYYEKLRNLINNTDVLGEITSLEDEKYYNKEPSLSI